MRGCETAERFLSRMLLGLRWGCGLCGVQRQDRLLEVWPGGGSRCARRPCARGSSWRRRTASQEVQAQQRVASLCLFRGSGLCLGRWCSCCSWRSSARARRGRRCVAEEVDYRRGLRLRWRRWSRGCSVSCEALRGGSFDLNLLLHLGQWLHIVVSIHSSSPLLLYAPHRRHPRPMSKGLAGART